jgi:F420-0:gamma-glutamyl ligase
LAIRTALPSLREKSIVVIASKVVSIWEGRCVSRRDMPDKDTLIIEEADKYLPRNLTPGGWVMHTITDDTLVPSAGIDESNADGYYILWPKDPEYSAKKLYEWMRKSYNVNELGIIISDSHTVPMRRGTIGMSLAYHGFVPLRDYRDRNDLFGRKLKVTQTNMADGLAAAAVVVMGEGGETTPLAVITDIPFVEFGEENSIDEARFRSFKVGWEEDLYCPFLSCPPWRKGGKANN